MFGRQEDARIRFDDAKLLAAAAIEGLLVQNTRFGTEAFPGQLSVTAE